jgi:hypothetical protein
MPEYKSDALLTEAVNGIDPTDDSDHVGIVEQLYGDIIDLTEKTRLAKSSLIETEAKLQASQNRWWEQLDSATMTFDHDIAAFRSALSKGDFSKARFAVYRDMEDSTKAAVTDCELLNLTIADASSDLDLTLIEAERAEREIHFADRLLSIDKEGLVAEIAETKAHKMQGHASEELRKKRNNYTIMGLVAGVILMVVTYPLTQWSLANLQEGGGIGGAILMMVFMGGMTVWLASIDSDWVWVTAFFFVLGAVAYFLPLLILAGGAAGGWALVTAQIRKDEASARNQSGETREAIQAIGARVIADCEGGFNVSNSELVTELKQLSTKFALLQEKVAARKAGLMVQFEKLQSFRATALGNDTR